MAHDIAEATEPDHEAAAAAVVSRVRRSAALHLAERELSGLRKRFGEVQAEIQRLSAARPGPGENTAARDRDLIRLQAELRDLGEKGAPALRAVVEARGDFDARVTDALSPLRQAASREGLAAIIALHGAITRFDVANAAARRVGAPEFRRPMTGLGLDRLASTLTRFVQV